MHYFWGTVYGEYGSVTTRHFLLIDGTGKVAGITLLVKWLVINNNTFTTPTKLAQIDYKLKAITVV